MDLVKTLLNRRWILRKETPELYFKIKDQASHFKDFFRDKLGYQLIINPLLIKLEKIPGKEQVWMGIQPFDEPLVYGMFTLVLMYLEELTAEEQFVLSQVTDYVKNQCPKSFNIDWTLFRHRKALIKVMRFCVDEGLIVLNDGSDVEFSLSEEAVAVLYENTGASKYFMRRFPVEISQLNFFGDLEGLEWQSKERDRGLIRRHRVYRRVIMEPVVYDAGSEDQDYLYIKNQRSVIAHDIETYLNAQFHLHLNGAMVLLTEDTNHSDCLPNRKNISDIILQLCGHLRILMIEAEGRRGIDDSLIISLIEWDKQLEHLKNTYGYGWSKNYREMGLKGLREELMIEMSAYGLIEQVKTEMDIRLLPAIAKILGDYPKDYYDKLKTVEVD